MDVRKEIGAKVRDLRKSRRWTQAELAQRLDLSQPQLSQLERGNGSFAAEHLLEIFRLFNVDASHFAPAQKRPRLDDQLWNAVARLGATHLVENDTVLPSQRVQDVHDVLRESLVSAPTSRVVTGLASVLVTHANAVSLPLLEDQLSRLGLSHRLGWLVENTLEAIRELRPHADRKTSLRYHRTEVIFTAWLSRSRSERDISHADLLDNDVRSEKTRALLEQRRSAISARWGVLSDLLPGDFAAAMEASRAAR